MAFHLPPIPNADETFSIGWKKWLKKVSDAIFYLYDNRSVSATATIDFASIAANGIGTATVTCTGAIVGGTVSLGPPSSLNSNLIWCGHVSAADTVTIRLHNTNGAGAVDPASDSWSVRVENI